MKKPRAQDGLPLLELAEAALHQVRMTPIATLTPYYIGTLPFVLAVLYFWSDMIQGATAWRYVGPAALVVSLTFVWMKCWQAVYCARIRASLANADTGHWNAGRVIRLIATQTFVHATGFFLIPVSVLFMIPFGHSYAFYQSVTVFGADEDNSVRAIAKRAWTEAQRWPGQNHKWIWLFSPLTVIAGTGVVMTVMPVVASVSGVRSEEVLRLYSIIFLLLMVPLGPIGFLIFLNAGIVISIIPALMKSLLGIETMVSLGGASTNTTFYPICAAFAFLCLDPVLKSGYALRCFHGESLSSGEDLRVALKRALASRAVRGAAIAAVLSAWCFGATPAWAQDVPAPAPAVAPEQLDQAISDVLNQSEYLWRMPKEMPVDGDNNGYFSHYATAIFETIVSAFKKVSDFIDWLLQRTSQDDPGSARSASDWMTAQRVLWWLVVVAVLVALGIIAFRIWQQRRATVLEAPATPTVVTPDLESDDVTADALPEDGWLNLARELFDKGDLRLAMRALFLATLAALSHRELIRITKSKSNREYLRELERRAHALPEVPDAFTKSVRAFERVWYGEHRIAPDDFDEFQQRQERIRTLAKQQ